MTQPKIYTMPFGKIYPLYLNKAEKKSRTQSEVDEIIFWLTGYDEGDLKSLINAELTLEGFFKNAPRLNPNRALITGVVCGVRVEEIEEPTLQEIRYLDKLIDELARGKAMGKILRAP